MDQLPFVTEVYKRDLRIEDYFIGYLLHPYVSLYTGRGCKIALHLLPVAADRRRAPLPGPQPGARRRGDQAGEAAVPAGEGVLLRRRHLHRQPAARRGDRARAGQAGRHLVVQRQGQRAARDAEGDEGQRAAAAAGRLRERQPADPAQHQEGHADRGRQASSPRTATSSASRSTAPSSSACPARRRRRSRRRSASPPRSTRTRIQVSLAAPYPGTFLYKQAVENGWLDAEHAELVDEHGVQIAPLHYPHLSHTEIFD